MDDCAREETTTPGAVPDVGNETATSREALVDAGVHGLRWISTGRTIVELMMMGSLVVLARLIPPAAFGPYAVAVIVQELAIGIQGQGVGGALVQRSTAGRDIWQRARRSDSRRACS